MRKILCVLLAMIMCLSTLSVAATATTPMNIVVDKTSVEYGETEATVNISIPNNPGIALIGFDVNYDKESMTLESATQGEIFSGELECNLNAFPFVFNVYSGSANKENSGVLVTLKFKLNENCETKQYDITIDNVEALNIDEEDVAYQISDGYIKVKAKEFTGLSFEDATYTYDGTEKTLAVAGVPADAKVKYESADFDTDGKAIDAGTYNITATVTKDGYEDWTEEAVLTINPKTVSVTGLAVENKEYDGSKDAALTGGSLTGLVARDAADQYCDEHECYRVKYSIPDYGTFADANAGTGKAVSIEEIKLTGCSADNYIVTQPTGLKANITKAPLAVKAKDLTVRIGSAIPTFDENSYEITSGKLYGEDKLTGKLATNCRSTANAKVFSITQGTLSAGANYELAFTAGKLTVVDKTVQNIKVDGVVTEKTYGDDGFKITVTPDETSKLDNFAITSSNTDVAAIDESGNVTIKAAGTTTISVKEAGNEDYAAFEKTWTLKVNKKEITITALNATKKIGQEDPTLEYKVEGTLVGDDAVTGALIRKPGEKLGKYDILIGTLVINDNYDITFVKGIFEIVDKTPQIINIAEIEEKTYGADPFKLEVTPDEASKLDTFTYTSSNADVAEIAADGTVTIKGAGEATFTVNQEGNEEYAATEKTVKLVVKPITVTVNAIDLENKTATVEGILDADKSGVELDFDKINTSIVSTEKTVEEEVTTVTTVLNVTNFVFKGEKAKNYVAEADATLTATVVATTVEDSLTDNEDVTVEAAPADDKTIIVTDIEVAPETEVKSVTIDVTTIADSKVNTVAILKDVVDAIVDLDEDVTLEVILKDGSSENKESSITLNTQALVAVQTAADDDSIISISVEKAEKEELTTEQATAVEKVSTKAPIVYSINIVDENGNKLAADFGTNGRATVEFYYKKPAGNGDIIVKYLNDLGELTNVNNPVYDSTNNFVRVILGHFSEYLIYTEPEQAPTGGGGGGGGTAITYSISPKDSIGGYITTNAEKATEGEIVTISVMPNAGYKLSKITVYDKNGKQIAVTEKGENYVFTMPKSMVSISAEFVKADGSEDTIIESGEFRDVKATDYYYDAVKWAVEKGITLGTSANSFSPNAECTRAQMVTFLWRAAGSPKATDNTSKFADVDVNGYYYDAVMWAVEKGITSGVSADKFNPNGRVDRAQSVTFLWRLAHSQVANNETAFTDVEADAYYSNAVAWAVSENITNGLTATSFGPKNSCTRAQIVTFLYRYFVK